MLTFLGLLLRLAVSLKSQQLFHSISLSPAQDSAPVKTAPHSTRNVEKCHQGTANTAPAKDRRLFSLSDRELRFDLVSTHSDDVEQNPIEYLAYSGAMCSYRYERGSVSVSRSWPQICLCKHQ